MKWKSRTRRLLPPPRTLMLQFFFFGFFYASGTPQARQVSTRFRLWGRPFHSSLLASFFLSFFLPFGVAMKAIHSAQLPYHISFLSFIRFICSLSSRGRLLNPHKRRLLCLHIQHSSSCLFEQWSPVSSLEAAACMFCLSISQPPPPNDLMIT